MVLPAREVWLHHSVTKVTADPLADMRAIDAIGIQRFGHVSYSWCFHPDGTVLEGAGLRVGAHTAGRNSTSFGFALIGDYTRRNITPAQADAVRAMIAQLIKTRSLRPGTYPTGGHRDLKATACPGDRAYALLPGLRVPWIAPTKEEDVALVDVMADPRGGVWALMADGTVRCFRGARDLGEPKGKAYWGPRVARQFEPNAREGYDVIATSGERYSYPIA